jgi:hypothetical protein
MAVLKTSGTLNRCPCVVLRERADTHARGTEHLSALRVGGPATSPSSRAATPSLPKVQQEGSSELKRVAEDDAKSAAVVVVGSNSSSASSTHTRRGSMDSNGSGISALEVYLRTKIGA